MSDPTETESVARLAERFILETNTFLARHWNAPRVWWPLKGAADAMQEQPGALAGTRTVRSIDAQELVSRLIRSCGIVPPEGGLDWHPRCAILLVVDGKSAQPVCLEAVDAA